MSTPPTFTIPSVTSLSLAASCAIVLFPPPDNPTSAVTLSSFISRLTLSSTSGISSPYLKETFSKLISCPSGTELPLYSIGSSSINSLRVPIASSTIMLSEELLMIRFRIVTSIGIIEAKKINEHITLRLPPDLLNAIRAAGTSA